MVNHANVEMGDYKLLIQLKKTYADNVLCETETLSTCNQNYVADAFCLST